MKKENKDYIVIYQLGTDGNIVTTLMNREEIIKLSDHFGGQEKMMIINGTIMKSLGNKIDLTKL